MENRISKTQENVLAILYEGTLRYYEQDQDYTLDDSDGNSYYVRRDTVSALKREGYLSEASGPALGVISFNLTEKANKYIQTHLQEQIQHLI